MPAKSVVSDDPSKLRLGDFSREKSRNPHPFGFAQGSSNKNALLGWGTRFQCKTESG